ncbi:MAG: DUF192 domain-containing protein [Chloroflexi bacterium]|nr:DUF192 domain-containing protein [Chloroflexota bacterium]
MVILPVLSVMLGFAIACGGSTIIGLKTAPPVFLEHPDCQEINRVQLPVENLRFSFGDEEFEVEAEIADNTLQRVQGYMCRSEIAEGTGMWFELPAESTNGFWMFNTYVPLDIIYFDATDVAVDAVTLPPCPRLGSETDNAWRSRCASESEQFGSSKYPHLNVLELPAGWLASQGFNLKDAPENVMLQR